MRVVVTAETRFSRTPDGAVWTVGSASHRFWTRYLTTFEQVRVVARTLDVPTPADDAVRVDGSQVEVWPVPHYVGPREYLRFRRRVGAAVRAAADHADAVILRVPSPIGALLASARQRRGLPYGLEVVGDPYDVFAPGVVSHPLRPLLRQWSFRTLRHQCASAKAVSYVTEQCLQARYPARRDAVVAAYSSVDLPPAAYALQLRRCSASPGTWTLVSVGSLDQLYKGIDTLIEAVARLTSAGTGLRLVHLGGGAYRSRLEQLAARLGVADRVVLLGEVPAGEPVRQRLDAADLFVLPSRAEGLPRALIEAMARGLPAIGARVGGVPELLADEDLVEPDDPTGLADAIARMLADPARMATASARNLAHSRRYSAEALAERREAFYHRLREVTERRVPGTSNV
ncbi:glycosyltransferase family 4 protein [Micromonospora sp. DT47]|uniref:glycosyltransferase family 4 protein n=1 Tax=Micromonospora sp. DT47 TaxID=3393431 RepID=UPI003CF74414